MKNRPLQILLSLIAVISLLAVYSLAVDLPSYSSSKPIMTYTAKSSGKEYAYSDATLKTKNGGYIECSTDECYIIDIKGSALKVSYPIPGGRRTGWFPFTVFTGQNLGTEKAKSTFKATKKITTYKWKNNTNNTYGFISKGDLCYLLRGEPESDWIQLIYPVSGGSKMAWVKGDDLYSNKITLNPTSVKFTKKGEKKTITATLSSDSADKVTWQSNKTSVASVNSSGVITAVGNGDATITATTLRGKKATVSVKVVIAHTWNSGTITKAATCKETGIKTFTCTVCHETKTETIPKNPNNHVGGTSVRNKINVTCGSSGYSGDTYCNGCGKMIKSGSIIAPTGAHTWNSGSVTKTATCKETGVRTYTCTVCRTTKSETIPIAPNNHAGGTEIRDKKEATGTENGYTGDTYCLGCGKKLYFGQVIPIDPPLEEFIDLSQYDCYVEPDECFFNGQPQTPSVIVMNESGDFMTEGMDYTVSYRNNVQIGKAAAIVTGIGKYTGSKTLEFIIAEQERIDITWYNARIDGSEFVYDGKAQTPSVVVIDEWENPLIEGVDYIVDYSDNVQVGKANATITGTGDYTGSKVLYFQIIEPKAMPGRKDLSQFYAYVDSIDCIFTGEAQEPLVTVINDLEDSLTVGVDYTVEYRNNMNVGTAVVIITGIGDYTGTQTLEFEIISPGIIPEPIDLSQFDAYIDESECVYNGKAQEPDVTVLNESGDPLTVGVDYTVDYHNNVQIGRASATIAGIGDYTGSKVLEFQITKPESIPERTDLSQFDAYLEAFECIYNGKAQEPVVTVLNESGDALTPGVDYTVTYRNNINVGTAAATVKGSGAYTGTQTLEFEIIESENNSERIDLSRLESFIDASDCVYNGKAQEPVITVLNESGEPLTIGVDYIVEYRNNVEVGTATATITGKGAYTGTQTLEYEITESEDNSDKINLSQFDAYVDASECIYNGKAQEPPVTVLNESGDSLTEGVDYTVAYSNNVEVGTATATITGKGVYTGTQTLEFEITESEENSDKLDLSLYDITVDDNSCIFNGRPQEPPVTVTKDSGDILTENIDYRVTYRNNVKAGVATVTITGIGSYTGSAEREFEIRLPEGSLILFSAENTSEGVDLAWSGTDEAVRYRISRKPSGGTWSVLEEVSGTVYSDQKVKNGTKYTYKVTAIGSNGSLLESSNDITTVFLTVPTIISVSNRKQHQLSVRWNKKEAVSGYELQCFREEDYLNDNFDSITVSGSNNTEKIITELNGSTKYFLRIRAFLHTDDETFYSDWSEMQEANVYEYSAPVLSKVQNTSKGIKVSWKKTGNAKKYRLYRKAKETEWKVVKDTISTSLIDTKAKAGVCYQYGVRCISVNGEDESGLSNEKEGCFVKPVSVKTAASQKGKAILVKWKKSTACSGFQVQYALDKGFKKSAGTTTVKGNKKVSATIKISKKSTYYIRLRGYKKINGKMYYSIWSNRKNVKAS